MVQMIMKASTAILTAAIVSTHSILCHGFSPAHPLYATRSSTKDQSVLAMSMRPTYDDLTQKVKSALNLQATDFTQTYNAQQWQAGNTMGTADWWTETSPQYLTGVSTCTRVNTDGTNEQCMINIWLGPSYDIPNLLMTFGEQASGRYAVTLDYVIRGATPIGSDPQYIETYYGPNVQQAWNMAYSQAGVTALSPSSAFESRVLDSPVKIAVGGLSKDVADALVRGHVDRLLGWVQNAQPVAARLRGSFNLRDDKLRQYYFRGKLAENVAEFGPDLGKTIAAVQTGPTAEAYVGGGS